MTDPATPPAPLRLSIGERTPQESPGSWVAPGAAVIGDVHLAAGVSIWYGCVLRADGSPIDVGADSNIQDGCVAHADDHGAVRIGRGVSVGHRAVLHGCTVDDGCLIGMGATVLTGAHIGAGSLVAAGAVVLEGTDVPPGSLVAGVPAKVRRPLTEVESERLRDNAASYVQLTEEHRRARPASAVPRPLDSGAEQGPTS